MSSSSSDNEDGLYQNWRHVTSDEPSLTSQTFDKRVVDTAPRHLEDNSGVRFYEGSGAKGKRAVLIDLNFVFFTFNADRLSAAGTTIDLNYNADSEVFIFHTDSYDPHANAYGGLARNQGSS